MAKMMLFSFGLTLLFIAAQVSATTEKENSKERVEVEEMNRNLLDIFGLGFINLREQCQARLNRVSSVLPTVGVTLTRLANGGVYFFPPATALTTYQGARTFCAEHGMHLVTINNEAENNLVLSRAKALGLAGVKTPASPGAWIGLRDIGTLNYQWIYNNAISTLWVFETSPTAGGLCVNYIGGADVTDFTKAWAATDCTKNTLTFICELEAPCNKLVTASAV